MKLQIQMALTVSMFLAEIIVGYFSGSVALIADSFHMLSDVFALFIAWYALKLSKLDNLSSKYTYGLQRAEILGGLVNGVSLLSLTFLILVEALQRFFKPEPITSPLTVLIVGSAGLFVNIIGVTMFHGHHHHHDHESSQVLIEPLEVPITQFLDPSQSRTRILTVAHQSLDTEQTVNTHHHHHHHQDFNMHGVYLHLLADLLGSVAVICSTLIVMFVDSPLTVYADPAISILISGLICASAIPLVRSACHILLQITPNHLNIDEIKKKLEMIPGVGDIHEFHVWQLSSTKFVASVHIVLKNDNQNFMEIAREIKQRMHVKLFNLGLWNSQYDCTARV